jgi:hypothetical protein
MSLKLSRLKKWLTLEDSAKYLSLLTREEVTTNDLLQVALQGDITLSINLVNSYPAQIGPKVSLWDARLFRMPLLKELAAGKSFEEMKGEKKRVFIDALVDAASNENHSSRDNTKAEAVLMRNRETDAAGQSDEGYAVQFRGDLLPDYSGVLEFDRDAIHSITGIWDLSMVGAESLDIEDRFYDGIDGPGVEWIKLCGVILKHPSVNQWANLVEHFKDGQDKPTPQDYFPSEELPEREPIVIRREELQRFADSLNEPEATTPPGQKGDRPLGTRERNNYLKVIRALCEYHKDIGLDQNSTAANQLLTIADTMGLPIPSKRTLENMLKEARDLED